MTKKQIIQRTPMLRSGLKGYRPCGNLQKAWKSHARNLMISGPYGTGKHDGDSNDSISIGYAVLAIDRRVVTPILMGVVNHNVKRY